jgi:phosphatidylserine/phosphatidylglycerophosphate/cardiolipin synthase-like enzyme
MNAPDRTRSDLLEGTDLRIELLVDGAEFWSRLEGDIAQARERVWVQTLSFEGDTAGRKLSGALQACGAPDRRILVDSFNRL